MKDGNKKYILSKSIKDFWFIYAKGDKGRIDKESGKKYFEMLCPNCFGSVNGNPIEKSPAGGGLTQYDVTFTTHTIKGNKYKILSCADKKACTKAWMKYHKCDEHGRVLKGKK